MSVLAYSELLKRITGINEKELEEPFKILSQSHTTKNRFKTIKYLSLYEPISIGKLLHKIGLPRGGGSYLTIKKFFLSLEKKGLLQKEKDGMGYVWKFTERGDHLKKYLLS
jgi:hypothetical protein